MHDSDHVLTPNRTRVCAATAARPASTHSPWIPASADSTKLDWPIACDKSNGQAHPSGQFNATDTFQLYVAKRAFKGPLQRRIIEPLVAEDDSGHAVHSPRQCVCKLPCAIRMLPI